MLNPQAIHRLVLLAFLILLFMGLQAHDPKSSSKALEEEPEQQDFLATPLGPLEHRGDSQSLFTVAKETTFFIEPLDEDGFVDYVSVLNQSAKDGVTVTNNAAILFVKAGLGLTELQAELRDQFFEMLGIEPPSPIDAYFKPLGKLSEEENSQFEQAIHSPWSADRFLFLAKWLDTNDTSLNLVVDGTRLPRCYLPLIPLGNHPQLFSIHLPVQQASRSAARALAARAMRRLHEGRLLDAEQDLLACHRLARLIGQSTFLISGLVGFEIESVAYQGDIALMSHSELTSLQALSYQQELRDLPPFHGMAQEIDVAERIKCLDAYSTVIRRFQKQELTAYQIEDLRKRHNEAFHVINQVFGMVVAEGRRSPSNVPDPELDRRIDRMRTIARGLVDEVDGKPVLKSTSEILDYYTGSSPEEIGRQVGEGFISLMLPAYQPAYYAENRARMRGTLAQVGFAMAAYRADHNAYPSNLNLLVPKYIQAIPDDLFNDQPLRFTATGDGYLIYSVGRNGTDDEGRSFDSQPPGDDLTLQISGKK